MSDKSGNARIGGHHAIHICPDPNVIGVQSPSNDRSGVVTAAAPQRRDDSVGGRADEACRNRDNSILH